MAAFDSLSQKTKQCRQEKIYTFCEMGLAKSTLRISNDFSPGVLRVTRTNSDCPCRTYKIAKEKAIIKDQEKSGNVSETTPVQPGIFEVCSECFATIYKGYKDNRFILILLGCTHSRTDFSSKRQRIESRFALLSTTDHPTFEKVLSSSIRRVCSGDNKELHLKTFGKPASVTLGA